MQPADRDHRTGRSGRRTCLAGPRGTGQDLARRILAEGAGLRAGAHADKPDRPERVPHQSRRCTSARRGRDRRGLAARDRSDIREIHSMSAAAGRGALKVSHASTRRTLTDTTFDTLLKLIEEPPPPPRLRLCTTDLSKMLPTTGRACQTFAFSRPPLPELVAAPAADHQRRRGSRRRTPPCRLIAHSARWSSGDRGLDARPARAARPGETGHVPVGPAGCSARSRRRRSSGSATSSSTATRPARSPSSRSSRSKAAISADRHRTCATTCATVMLVHQPRARCPRRCL